MWLQIDCRMKNIEERVLKQFPLSHMHMFKKNKEGGGEAKLAIPANKIMIIL